MKQIYLDNNSTTPLDERVLEAMLPYLKDKYGNASSVHNFGREAKTAIEEAREKIAGLLGADPAEIYYTSGGTESDNLAVIGTAFYNEKKKKHVITSRIEHHAVLEAVKFLEKRGFGADYIDTDNAGIVSADELKEKMTEQTSIVSIMHANNEVGTIQDIPRLAEIAKSKGAVFHTDAVQSAGKIKVNVEDLNVDMLSMTAHKMYGPKGTGILYIRKGFKLTPLFYGGHHEKKRRPGTENVAGIVGFARALELAESRRENDHKKWTELAELLIDGVQSKISDVSLNGPRDERRIPSTVNLSFKAVEGESIILSLDMKGIAVSSGSACTSGSLEASHVLTAMNVPVDLAQSSIRFSMGRFTTRDDIEYTISVLPEIIERLRAMSPLYNQSKQ
ncbi:MAG: cysteine desulfurase NifS [candidate division Zixibacteria bacterium HGW-Zixibacteria-1]|nr:MAG: cysteine desulfurase NifS [candidate division Zixibacteria bacterium HGW-Zixibacteria-1]